MADFVVKFRQVDADKLVKATRDVDRAAMGAEKSTGGLNKSLGKTSETMSKVTKSMQDVTKAARGVTQTVHGFARMTKAIDDAVISVKSLKTAFFGTRSEMKEVETGMGRFGRTAGWVQEHVRWLWRIFISTAKALGILTAVFAIGLRTTTLMAVGLLKLLSPLHAIKAGVILTQKVIDFLSKVINNLAHGLIIAGKTSMVLAKALDKLKTSIKGAAYNSKFFQREVKKFEKRFSSVIGTSAKLNKTLSNTSKVTKKADEALVKSARAAMRFNKALSKTSKTAKSAGENMRKAGEAVSKFGTKLDKSSKNVTKTSKGLLGMRAATLLTIAAAGALTVGLGFLIKSLGKLRAIAAEQEMLFVRLKNQIITTGERYADIRVHVDGFLESMRKLTTYSRTKVMSVLGHVSQMVGNVKMGMLGTKMAADMAASGFTDFESAGRYLAMAIQGNVSQLARYIPELRTSYGLINDNMTASEKWAITSKLIQKVFGGMATGELQAANGMMKNLRNAVTRLIEIIGEPLLGPLKDLLKTLTSIVEKLIEMQEAIKFSVDWVIVYAISMDAAKSVNYAMSKSLERIVDKVTGAAKGMKEFHVITDETTDSLKELRTATDEYTKRLEWQEAFGYDVYKKRIEFMTQERDKHREYSIEWMDWDVKIKTLEDAYWEKRMSNAKAASDAAIQEKEHAYDFAMLSTQLLDTKDLQLQKQIEIVQAAINELLAVGATVETSEQLVNLLIKLKDLQEELNTKQNKTVDAQKIQVRLAERFADGVASIMVGARKLEDVFKGIVKQLVMAITKAVILSAIFPSAGGILPFLRFAQGGTVYAQTGLTIPRVGSDTVPAMLTPGEEVTPMPVASKYRSELKAMREGTYDRKFGGGDINIIINAPDGLLAVTERGLNEMILNAAHNAGLSS